MPLSIKAKIVKNPDHAKTQYITVPAAMAQDSAYPFTNVEWVEIQIVQEKKELVIREWREPTQKRK